MPSTAFKDTQDTQLGRGITRLTTDKKDLSGAYLLREGLDAFAARMVLADAAERSLDIQYYIWHNDAVGKLFAGAVLRAAERGVRVRVLLDDIQLEGLDRELAALDSHPNIEIRIFNPFVLRQARVLEMIFSFSRINRRMHNKSFTADSQITIVGGRNIGDEYYDFHKEVNFDDLDILTIGPVVEEVSDAFDQYWNSEFAIPVAGFIKKVSQLDLGQLRTSLAGHDAKMQVSEYMKAVRESVFLVSLNKKTLPIAWGKAYVVYDEPEKINHDSQDTRTHLSRKVAPFVNDSHSELILISPYFIPGENALARLQKLIARDVRVRVLTNSLASTDVSIVYAGYMPYRVPLLQAGVELYESKPSNNIPRKRKKYKLGSSSRASLHTKLYIFDRQKIFVGSYNLDPRSSKLNTELGIVFENEKLAETLALWWDEHIDAWAYKLVLAEEHGTEEDEETEYSIEWLAEENGKQQRYKVEPHAGFWRRFGIDFMSILPIEDQL